jgi:hypothetical protein
MSAPANQSTLARTNQLESPPFRINPFEQLGSGHRVLHKSSLDFVPSGLGIFANTKTDQIRKILMVPRRLSKHKVVPRDPYTPEGDSTNKEPETCHRLKFARNRAGKQRLGLVREGPPLSTAGLGKAIEEVRRKSPQLLGGLAAPETVEDSFVFVRRAHGAAFVHLVRDFPPPHIDCHSLVP